MPNGLLSAASFPKKAPSTYGLLGLDEGELKQARLSALLTGLAQGLLGGRNLPEGLGLGFGQASRGMEAARDNAFEDARVRRELERQQQEDERRSQKEAAITQALGGVTDPKLRALLTVFPDEGMSQYFKKEFAPPAEETSDIRTLRAMGIDPHSPEGRDMLKRHFLGAPERPREMPLDATVYDEGKHAYVYAGGPYKGQVARPGPQESGNATSDYERRKDDATAYYKDQLHDPEWKRKVLEYSRGTGSEFPEPTEVLDITDPSEAEVGNWYRLQDGKVAKFLGNDRWQVAE